MGFESKIENGILLVMPIGRFDAYEVPGLESWLTEHISPFNKFVIVHMSQTAFVDTRALTCFVAWMKKLRQQNGDLVLAELPDPIRVIVELMRLDRAFHIFESVDKAQSDLMDKATIEGSVPQKAEAVLNSLAIQTERGISILHLLGRIDAFEADKIQKYIEISTLEKWVVIDLSEANFLDSAGLALLVRILKKSRSANGEVALVASQHETANRILSLTRLDDVFHKVATVEAGQTFLKDKSAI